MTGIYKITNKVNKKVYIGKSSYSCEDRWRREKRGSTNDHFKKAIEKYGKENFEFEVIEEAKENLDELEMKYILEYKSYDNRYGYNKTYGGSGQYSTVEIRKNMSEIHKNLWKNEDHRKKMSEAHMGFKQSEESIRKRSESMHITEEHRKKLNEAAFNRRGRKNKKPMSEDTKRKMSESRIGRQFSEETKKKISDSNKKPKSEEHKKAMSDNRKMLWKNQEYRNKMIEARKKKENKNEI